MDPAPQGDASEVPAIEFRHVSLSLDEKLVLSNVSFELRRGHMMLITGTSGSGKSVLLRLAIGLLHPDEGEILIDGREIQGLGEEELLPIRSRSMGLVFQEDALFTALSVHDNAAYRLTEHGWSEEETERAVHEILRFVGLEEHMEKLHEELSIGMRRRLELARALVGWPSIMLFDEPTSGLDPLNTRQVLDLIIRARDIQKISSLYVTKELHEIPYLVTHYAVKDETGEITVRKGDTPNVPETKVMLLEEGGVAFFGSPAEFEDSSLPAVTRMRQVKTDRHTTNFYI